VGGLHALVAPLDRRRFCSIASPLNSREFIAGLAGSTTSMSSSVSWQAFQSRLACPACGGTLGQSTGNLRCEGCGEQYPIISNGELPVLIPKQSELAPAVPSYLSWTRVGEKGLRKKGYREVRRLPPTSIPRIAEPQREAFLKQIEGKWVLNIGAGFRTILSGDHWVNLDISPHNNVDIIADGHFLPFKDGSFDAVTSNSVFEHLKDPFRVAAEVKRILKPGGLVWCDVPFSYPVHGSPHDFFRYTLGGLKSIYAGLEPVDMGPTKGPFASIARFGEVAADTLFPGSLGFAFRWVIAWSLFGFKFLDPYIVRKNPDAGTAFYFLARKPETAN